MLCAFHSDRYDRGGGERVEYYHHDALGSVVAVTDSAGNPVYREEYL